LTAISHEYHHSVDGQLPYTPKSILRAPLTSISPNLVLGLGQLNGIGIITSPHDAIKDASEAPNLEGSVKEAKMVSKARRSKKAVRILLDPHTELTDTELRRARDNYLQEQSKLRGEILEQHLHKAAIESARELILNPPVISKCSALLRTME
jgi:hypothetical protein